MIRQVARQGTVVKCRGRVQSPVYDREEVLQSGQCTFPRLDPDQIRSGHECTFDLRKVRWLRQFTYNGVRVTTTSASCLNGPLLTRPRHNCSDGRRAREPNPTISIHIPEQGVSRKEHNDKQLLRKACLSIRVRPCTPRPPRLNLPTNKSPKLTNANPIPYHLHMQAEK
jgi:hypothetical protein